MNIVRNQLGLLFLGLAGVFGAADAWAAPFGCSGVAGKVTAVTDPDNFYITAAFNTLPKAVPQLESLLAVKINTERRGCLVAHLSGMARITDNYVVFQVKVDGQPIEGGQQLTGLGNPDEPVVFVTLDEGNPPLNDEQLTDPTKVVSYNFFGKLERGYHLVEVFAGAGSGVCEDNPDCQDAYVSNLVLTLEHL
ncbi:MAG: hypothetical protein ACRESZ_12705 [Methylococcales bacterium]